MRVGIVVLVFMVIAKQIATIKMTISIYLLFIFLLPLLTTR